jgi:hypothetical protein
MYAQRVRSFPPDDAHRHRAVARRLLTRQLSR